MEFSSGLHSESVAVEFIHEIIPQLGGKLCQSQYKKVSSPKISSVFSKPVAIYAGNYFQGFDVRYTSSLRRKWDSFPGTHLGFFSQLSNGKDVAIFCIKCNI